MLVASKVKMSSSVKENEQEHINTYNKIFWRTYDIIFLHQTCNYVEISTIQHTKQGQRKVQISV